MTKQKLKCWKKSLGERDWSRKDNKYSYAKVWKTGLPLKEMRRRGKEGTYIFSGRVGRSGETTKKYFKTRKKAEEFASKFMKERDKC